MLGRRQAGQILVLALLGIALLSGLVVYVINVGNQVNRRVAMQNAADATAISGAAWMARSMNVVATANVGQSRMLALVPIMDSFPLATKMAHEEVDAWCVTLRAQLGRPIPDKWIADGLSSLAQRMQTQCDILAPMDMFWNGSDNNPPAFDVQKYTTYALRGAGNPPNGELWQAAESLDNIAQATAETAPVLSQANAVRYGLLDQASTAFIMPVRPKLPTTHGTWSDWKSPVTTGIIPDRAFPQRLGVYDRLYRWRKNNYEYIREPDHMVAGRPGHGAIRGGAGNVAVGGRTVGRGARGYTTDPNDHWAYRTVGRILRGYTVYGPYEWMMRQINMYATGYWTGRGGWGTGDVPDTYFHEYMQNISGIKLKYMWDDATIQKIHYPQYQLDGRIIDYPTAQALGRRADVRVTKTLVYKIEIRSRYPKNAAGWLSAGSYYTNDKLPQAMWLDGWQDPGGWGLPKIADYIWEDQYSYETTEDWDIGIHMRVDGTGQPVWQRVYMVAEYIYGGLDVGGDVDVRNPANFTGTDGLPAPMMLDVSGGDYDMSQPNHDLGVRRDTFTYLGVATTGDKALAWPDKFTSGTPFKGVCTVAQAEIFNRTSWDLWTPDWKVKLVPVTRWGDWTSAAERGISEAADSNGFVNPDDVSNIHQYMQSLDPAAVDQMMKH